MDTNEAYTAYNSRNSFKRIFDFKGEIAPIAEKANLNYDIKAKNAINREQRLHYFTVGHTFKNIDTEHVFEILLDEETREKRPYTFLSLQQFNTDFCTAIKEVISNIRHINSHYIHDFERIKTDNIPPEIITFLKESFELAVIQIYLKENNITYLQFIEQKNTDTTIVKYLHDKFYSLDNTKTDTKNDTSPSLAEYIAFRNTFKTLSKEKALDSLLFVTVDAGFPWKLEETHTACTITQGTYLSFNACLFLLSLFLYKSEANQLISKIKGFKKNKTDEEKSKREIFSFFSKKFSSQDIDSEENHLVKFRDLIQYINHYPVEWNKDLKLESGHPLMTDKLIAKITDMEIDRAYPDYAGNNKFQAYAKELLWNVPSKTTFTTEEIEAFAFEINKSPELKDAKKKLHDLQAKMGLYGFKKVKNEQEIAKTIKRIKWIQNDLNPVTENVKKRLAQFSLYGSYGRNQDRFMDFATRYLAEQKYFGVDAEFKMYKYFTSEEQNTELATYELPKDKKAYDKLRFHKGKLVHFSTFENHLKKYESWDTPFVIENNAIQVKLSIRQDNKKEPIEKILSIQRALMLYFLEDALFQTGNNNIIENKGRILVEQYYTVYNNDFVQSKTVLEENDSISPEQKNALKKIVPKRLLHRYFARSNKL